MTLFTDNVNLSVTIVTILAIIKTGISTWSIMIMFGVRVIIITSIHDN